MASSPIQIAITGATGFVGRYVLDALLSAGHNVRAMIRPQTPQPDITHKNLDWHPGRLGSDDAAFMKGVDVVIHIAGLIKAKKREDYFAVNADMAGALAAAAAEEGVKRFVLLSSMAARAPELSDYAASKEAGESAVKANFTGDLAVIRAPAVFGPGDEATAPFFALIQKGVLPAPGGRGWKKRKLSFVYVKDLARDMAAAAVDGRYDGQTVSPSTHACLTWPEFAAEAALASGRAVRPLPIPLAALYAVASATSVTSRLFGLGHLTLGKLGEFLYDDWSSEDVIHGATPLKQALIETLAAQKE